MPTDITATPEQLAAMRDKRGRLFDPKKFRAAWDSLGRWVNAHAGRKKTKKTKQLSLSMSSDSTAPASETTAPADAAAPSDQTPPPYNSAETTPPPAPKPDFSDIDRAAGAATPVPGASGASEGSGEGEDPGLGFTTADSIIGIIQTALILIGEEEGQLSRAEVLVLRPPLERVLKKYNVGAAALPAEVDLAVAFAGLIVARLQKPKTAKFAAKVRAWFVDRFFSAKGRALAHDVREAVKS
jgi:hypothetical protein